MGGTKATRAPPPAGRPRPREPAGRLGCPGFLVRPPAPWPGLRGRGRAPLDVAAGPGAPRRPRRALRGGFHGTPGPARARGPASVLSRLAAGGGVVEGQPCRQGDSASSSSPKPHPCCHDWVAPPPGTPCIRLSQSCPGHLGARLPRRPPFCPETHAPRWPPRGAEAARPPPSPRAPTKAAPAEAADTGATVPRGRGPGPCCRDRVGEAASRAQGRRLARVPLPSVPLKPVKVDATSVCAGR